MGKRLVTALLVLAAAMALSAPARAHNNDCLIAVHVGGIRVHPACG